MYQLIRSHARRPLFAGTVILTLALGTGLIAAVLALLHEVFVRPLPYPDADRLAVIYSTYPERGWDRASAAIPELRDLRERSRLCDEVVVFAAFRNMNLGTDEGAILVETNFSDAAYLRLQDARPILGRLFAEEETREGAAAAVVVLHHRFWQARLGGRADVIGTTLRLNDRPFTVIGVLGPDYRDLGERWQRTEIFVPLAQAASVYGPQVFTTRSGREMYGLARLRPGVTLAQAQQEADRIALDLAREHPTDHSGRGFLLMDPRTFLFREARPLAAALGAGALVVLLIACANLAHLFLVRGAARAHEAAVRAALGADRVRLLRHQLGEIAGLTLTGGLLGVGLGRLLVGYLNIPGTVPLPHFVQAEIDVRVTVATVALLALCAAGFGLWPAWRASRVDLRAALGGASRSTPDRRQARRRLILVGTEVAMATMLLIGTGLTARTLWWLENFDPGYASERLLTGLIEVPRTRYADRPALQRLVRRLHAELQTIPGIDGAALWGPRMLGRATYNIVTTPDGLDPTDPANQFMTRRLQMTPDAFALLRIPLLRGRPPTDQPAAGAPWEIVISDKYARRFFPDRDPLGRRVMVANTNPVQEMLVVGVAGPVHHYPRTDSEENVLGDIYLSMWSIPSANLAVLVRAKGDPAALASVLRERVGTVDPALALFDVQTMDARVTEQEKPQQFAAGVFAMYGGLATFLAVIGVYGVLAFTVGQRTREFGVRLAVGARPAQILARLMAQGLRCIGLGIAAGLAMAWLLAGFAHRLLVGVQPLDPFVYGSVAGLMLVVALLAWLVPAIRAARVDPLHALRHE